MRQYRNPAIVLISIILFTVFSMHILKENTKGPEHSLFSAVDAFRQSDTEEFRKYVDIESVSESIVDSIFTKNSSNEGSADDEFEEMGREIASALTEYFKILLSDKIAEEIEKSVAKGNFTRPYDIDDDPTAAEVLWYRLTNKNVTVKGIKYINENKGRAQAGIELFDSGQSREFLIELEMKDTGSHWKITGINNAVELVSVRKTK